MFKHVVMWKFKLGIAESDKHKMKNLLESLFDKKKIPELKGIEVGYNISDNSSSYDIILITYFNSESDYESYRVNSDHLKVVEFVNTLVDKRAVVDYFVKDANE